MKKLVRQYVSFLITLILATSSFANVVSAREGEHAVRVFYDNKLYYSGSNLLMDLETKEITLESAMTWRAVFKESTDPDAIKAWETNHTYSFDYWMDFFGYVYKLDGYDVYATKEPIRVTVNGKRVPFTDVIPVIVDSRTMVPLKAAGEAIGLTVGWNDKTKTASFTDGTKKVEFTIGSVTYKVDDKVSHKKLDVAPQIVNARTLLPIKYLAEEFGWKVGWIGNGKFFNTVVLTK